MFGERRDEYEGLEFEAGEDDAPAQIREVVLVGMSDLLDQSVYAQAFEHVRDLRSGAVGERTQIFVAQAADEELAAHELLEEALVAGGKEVQAAVRAPVLGDSGVGTLERAGRLGGTRPSRPNVPSLCFPGTVVVFGNF